MDLLTQNVVDTLKAEGTFVECSGETSKPKVVGHREWLSVTWLNASGLLSLDLSEQLLSFLCFVCPCLVGDGVPNL